MSDASLSTIVQVIAWTCVMLFVATSLVTVLALLGKVRLGGGDGSRHHYYLRQLFLVLLVEVAGISISVYAAYLNPAEDRIAAIRKLPPVTLPADPVPTGPGPQVVQEKIVAKVYATSDGPQSDTKTVEIPPGSKYVTHSVNEWTRNGRATSSAVPVIDEQSGQVKAVRISASVGKRDLFGPRNWIGAELVVTVERVST